MPESARLKVGLSFALIGLIPPLVPHEQEISLRTIVTVNAVTALRAAAIASLLLWFVSLVTGHTMGGFVHAFLVLGIVLGLVCYVRGNDIP